MSTLTELSELRRAIELIEGADPEALRLVRSAMAAEGVPFYRDARTMHHGPSAAGIDPRNAHIIAATEASHRASVERDRTARVQTQATRDELAERLAAGQSPENAHNVRQSVRGAGG